MVRLAVNWINIFFFFLSHSEGFKNVCSTKRFPTQGEGIYWNCLAGMCHLVPVSGEIFYGFLQTVFIPEVIICCRVWISEFY